MANQKRPFAIGPLLVVVFTLCLGLIVCEVAFRLIDGYRLDRFALFVREGHNTDPPAASLPNAERLRIDPSFDVSWYTTDPPNYDRSPKFPLPADWVKAVSGYKPVAGEPAFVADELKLLYNNNYLAETCKTGPPSRPIKYYQQQPGFVYAFKGPDDSTAPPFRIVPRGWDRGSDYYNNFGFRGPDITPRKSARTIRIAFLGASTTANGWPFTYPEYVAHFLNLWAKANKIDVDFDVINASRGGVDSPIIAKIMRYEVAPLHPDIVIYYEGANDLETAPIVRMANGVMETPHDRTVSQTSFQAGHLPLEGHSALVDRIYELVLRRGGPAAEPAKPPHTLTFDLTQKDPDLSSKDLPFNLPEQIDGFKAMSASSKSAGAEFFLSSFVVLVQNGMLLDRERNSGVWHNLNEYYWPVTYSELREGVDFQNAVYRKFARTDHDGFLDMDKYFPQDPDFFADYVHFGSTGGYRLQGWIFAQLLAPYIRAAVKSGELPKPAFQPDPKEIAWATSAPIKFSLSCPR